MMVLFSYRHRKDTRVLVEVRRVDATNKDPEIRNLKTSKQLTRTYVTG